MPYKDPEKARQSRQEYRKNNLEKLREAKRKHYREYRENNREKEVARLQEYYKNNRDAIEERRLKRLEKRREPNETIRPKPDKCEVPGCERTDVVWDHCHGTSLFRSWLCGSHNKAAGLCGDDPHEIIKFGLFLLAEQQRVEDRAAALEAERKQQEEQLGDNHL